jgi:hypothetical protein
VVATAAGVAVVKGEKCFTGKREREGEGERERGGAATTQRCWVFECDVGCSGKDGGESGGGGRKCG